MSSAWEVTPDDIEYAMKFLGIPGANYDRASEILLDIDCDMVEEAALYYTDFSSQRETAHAEICRQLKEMNL